MKVTESVRIEDSVKKDLIKIAGELQISKGQATTISDAIGEAIKIYKLKPELLRIANDLIREGENGESSDCAATGKYLLGLLGEA